MNVQTATIESEFRDVTPEEIAHYQKHGWVKLEKFVPVAKVNEMLAFAKDKMGEDGARNLPPEAFTYFAPLTIRGLDNPIIKPLLMHFGQSARQLMARRANIGIRYFADLFAAKQPARKKQAGKGGAGSSGWHQDYPSAASDRSGGMVFWMPLTDMGPEKGTLAFLNGSHRHGVMGHHATYHGGDLLDYYPEVLDDCSDTGNLTYAAGDVTVHTNITVHSAGSNQTDDPRWTYLAIFNPADACWNGGAADAFSTEGMTLNQEFPDDRFPIVA